MHLYRTGTKGQKNLTPRVSDVDGLSLFESLEHLIAAGSGRAGDSVQVFDAELLLQAGLHAYPSPPPEGHVSLRPLDPAELDAWIASRDMPPESPWTGAVRRSIVRTVRIS